MKQVRNLFNVNLLFYLIFDIRVQPPPSLSQNEKFNRSFLFIFVFLSDICLVAKMHDLNIQYLTETNKKTNMEK